ncbi:MAG: nitrate reductase [Clostridia bacterium]|nr:nitrate reductase [Clostridia bacterium]
MKGGISMEKLMAFISSVAAGVIANAISKWLDRRKKKKSRKPKA